MATTTIESKEVLTDEASPLPDMELLNIVEVFNVPGVMQTGNIPLPAPFMNLSKGAPRHALKLNFMFWLRKDIEEWVNKILYPRRRRKFKG